MIKEITPVEAWDILQSSTNAVVLDVRSTMEFHYVGHPPGAVLVPLKEPPDWEIDPEFVDRVRKVLQGKCGEGARAEDLTILSLCRSGQRSLTAAELLADAGFTQVYNIKEGFEGDRDDKNHRNTINGWRARQLPWEQS